MKNFLVILLVTLYLIGCSSMELEPVSSAEGEAQKILAMNLTHEENLIEAKKLETPRKVSVVTLLLTNARDKEIKSKADLIESEEFASLVIVSGDGSSFRGSDQSIVEKSGMLDYNSEFQSFYLEGLKDLSSDSMSHKLHLTVQHNSKTKRNYNSANLCDKWGRCDDNLMKIKVISSTAANCDTNVCDYSETIELDLSDELLKKSINSGMSIRYNYKNNSNKVEVSTAYLMGYLKVAN